MHVHNADYVAAADQRHRKHRLVGVLDEVLDVLEARIGGRIGRKRHGGSVLGNPARDAFSHLHAELAEVGRVGHLRYQFGPG
jgi:hypothetical protein